MKTVSKVFTQVALLTLGMIVAGPLAAQSLSETSVALGTTAAATAGAVKAVTAMPSTSEASNNAVSGAPPSVSAPTAPAAAVSQNNGPIAPSYSVSTPPAVLPENLAMLSASEDQSGEQEAGGTDTLSITGAEAKKVPDAVKNVMKRLNSSTTNITLEDLNAAREAIARLDMMIELEKKVKDLSEVRKDRTKASDLENAIPASALNRRLPSLPQMPVEAPSQPTYTPPPVPYVPPSSKIVVERIFGANGRYVATIKEEDNNPTLVRVGDKLTDGSEIVGISDEGVTVLNDKKRKTISVRNVNSIFRSH